MPRAAQQHSRVRSWGKSVNVRYRGLDLARRGLLVALWCLRRGWRPVETQKTILGNVFTVHVEPEFRTEAVEIVRQRLRTQLSQCWIVANFLSDTRSRDTAGPPNTNTPPRNHTAGCRNSTPMTSTLRGTAENTGSGDGATHPRAQSWRDRRQVVGVALYCPRCTTRPVRPHAHCEGPPHGITVDQENRQAPLVRG